MTTGPAILRRSLLLILAVVLAWRVVSIRMAEHQVEHGGEGAADRALAWNAHHPHALYAKAVQHLETQPETAEALLRQAYRANPAAAGPLLAQATLEQQRGNKEQATALIDHAARLMPARARIQQAIAAYWAKEGDLAAALRHWSQAMTADQSTTKELFPILLKVAESPSRAALKPFALSPPPWWEQFFVQTARGALDLETVRALHAFRRASTTDALTAEERTAYIQRLQKEGLTAEAYLTWINGLSVEEQAHLGVIHNGSFELEPTNTGFDWHLATARDIAIRTTGTYGIDDSKALRILFKRRERPTGRAIWQPLFLDSANYRVSGMVRTDGLDSIGGLQWILLCTAPEASILGESERFLGSSEWRGFSFEAQVPIDCRSQELRLRSAGPRDFEHKVNGGIWFDKLAMRKIREPTEAPANPTQATTDAGKEATNATEPATDNTKSPPDTAADSQQSRQTDE